MTLRIILPLLLLSGCLSSRPSQDNELQQVSESVKNTPRYRQAKRFDEFLRNSLTPEESRQLVEECRRNSAANLFCFSIRNEKSLRRFLKKEQRESEVHFSTPPESIPVQVIKGKVKNWNKTQKSNLKGLLSGMRELSLDELKKAGNFALKRKECPNHISVAAAALLEIHLNSENLNPLIASLYEKGARCVRRGTANHEHYLTRAALFRFLEKKYAAAEKLFSKIRSADAYSGRSLYWLYRTRSLMGKKKEAQQTLDRLKTRYPLSFHALMAMATQQTDPLLKQNLPGLLTRSSKPSTNAMLEQIETLRETGFSETAFSLVSWTLARFAPPEPGARAYLGSLGDTPTQIRVTQALIAARPALRHATYLQLAYPKVFFDLFEDQSSRADPYLLLAIARKESLMDPAAVSRANAQGLMQLNPETAKRLSGRSDLDLFNPEINTDLAARYINDLQSAMKGQLPLVIASYNAGEQTVANWTRRYPTNDLLLFIDLIPYRETRDYVGYVLSNYFWYKHLYSTNSYQALISVINGEVAKVDLPQNRTVKSLADEAQKTSETWPEEPAPPNAFMDRWNQTEAAEQAL